MLAGGLAVLTASVVTVVVGLSDPAAADTRITSVTQGVVALPDGSEHDARIGDLLPPGARLRTGSGGGARLSTAHRDVYVGALSTVRVVDGVHEALERGQVMVDSRRGPQLDLATSAGKVAVAGRSLARVERAAVLRLGVFQGSAALTATGRQAVTTVPALYQVLAQYGARPGRPTALALTKDRWETELAGALVGNDTILNDLQDGLRGAQGDLVLDAAPVALRGASACDPERGEHALSVAVAEQARRGSSAGGRLNAVCGARSEGGSWGVVAAIMRADVTAVSGALQAALGKPEAPTQLAGPPVDLSNILAPTPVTGSGPTVVPTTAPPGPTPTPTRTMPTTSASPDPVNQVVTIVTGLLPKPSAPPVVPVPTVTPSPLLRIGPLTVGLH